MPNPGRLFYTVFIHKGSVLLVCILNMVGEPVAQEVQRLEIQRDFTLVVAEDEFLRLERNQERCIPPGLKPISWPASSGTAEAVPFQSGT